MATRKQVTTRLAKRIASADTLKTVLTNIPKVDPEVVQTAADELMNAADDYMASQPLVDPKGRRSKSNLAEARASVAALHKHLAKAQEQLSDLSLDARAAIGQATNAPIGKMLSDIEEVRKAIQIALKALSARPHKVADAARNILAYQVAVVFTDILKKTPSSARAEQLKEKNPRGGAAYDRVLRATLKAAGVTNYDSGPLITAGLRLLRDPDLPSRS